MKTYISGPLAGSPELSREEKVARFKRAEKILHERGLETLDPNDLDAVCGLDDCGEINGHTWACWLRTDLIGMLEQCDSIALLPAWETSKGAILEFTVAERLGWKIIDLSTDERVLNE